jgi:hypothetical protein
MQVNRNEEASAAKNQPAKEMRIADRRMRQILAKPRKSPQSVPMSGVQFRNPQSAFPSRFAALLLAVIPGQSPVHHNRGSGDVVRIG